MTKRYRTLQKKVQDLESELLPVLSHPFEPEADHVDYFYSQFAFLNNLLGAEIASNPSKPHHLSHISNRLSELRAKFDNWELSRAALDPVETGSVESTCSCTDSCKNDDGDMAENEDYYEVEPVVELEPEAKDELVTEADKGLVECETEKGVWDWANVPVLAGGIVIVGLVIGLLREFYGCLHYYVNHQDSLIPT